MMKQMRRTKLRDKCFGSKGRSSNIIGENRSRCSVPKKTERVMNFRTETKQNVHYGTSIIQSVNYVLCSVT